MTVVLFDGVSRWRSEVKKAEREIKGGEMRPEDRGREQCVRVV